MAFDIDQLLASDLSDLEAAAAKPAAQPVAQSGDRRAGFIEQYAPMAARVSEQIGVDPKLILAQMALESDWGNSVVPGTNNLGNIKDFSGNGAQATDNQTGSRDGYRRFSNADEFGDHYASLIQRKYRNAVGAGEDADKFVNGLSGYAEDVAYGSKIKSVYNTIRGLVGGSGAFAGAGSDQAGESGADRHRTLAPSISDVAGDLQQQGELDAETFGDAVKHGAKTAVKQIPQMAGGVAALVGDVFGNDYLKNAGLDYARAKGDEMAAEARGYEDIQDALRDDNFGKWVGHALGYTGVQLVQALGTGGIGALVAKAGLKRLVQGTVARATEDAAENLARVAGERAVKSAVTGGATKEVAQQAGDAAYAAAKSSPQLLAKAQAAGKAAGDLATQKFGGAVAMAANSFGMEAGQIYPEAAEEAAKTGADVDLGRVTGAAGAAATLEFLPEMRILNKLFGAGKGVAKAADAPGILRRVGKEVPTQMALEGGTEAMQTPLEAYGASKDPFTAEGWRDIINSAAMGAVGGAIGGGVAAIPNVPVEQQKPEFIPNSPLSNAANTAAPVAPDAPAGDAGANFGSDELNGKHAELAAFITNRDNIRALRNQDANLPAEAFNAWRMINDPSLPLASRIRMLEQAHTLASTLPNFKLVDQPEEFERAAAPEAERNVPATIPPQAGGAVDFPGRVIDGEATREQDATDALPRQKLAGPQEDAATQATTPALSAPAPEAAQPPADASAALTAANRMDARTNSNIRELVGQGFTTISKGEDGKFKLSNKDGLGVTLRTPADVQVARTAIRQHIDSNAHAAASSPLNDTPLPSDAQIASENYKKGHVNLHGLDIAVENPQGSVRSGVDQKGKAWESKLAHHYGYLKRTAGADGDPVDVFVGGNPSSTKAYVVDQINPETGAFDEHKILLGFDGIDAARAGYQANYEAGWKGLGAITPMDMDELKAWLKTDTTQPVAYKQAAAVKNTVEDWFDADELDRRKATGFKSREKLLSMPIDDFLALAKPIPANASAYATDKADAVAALIESGTPFSDIPFLMFESNGTEATVTGHEGRHRAMALKALGFSNIPVVFVGDIRWSEQNDSARFDYRKQWPTVLHGEEGGERPFPVARDEAALDYGEQPAASIPDGDAVTPEPAPQEAAQPAADTNDRAWMRAQVEALIHRKAFARQIGKGAQIDKLIALAKRYMGGEDVKPAKFKSYVGEFKADAPTDALVVALHESVKAESTKQAADARAKAKADADAPAAEAAQPAEDAPEVQQIKVSRETQRQLFKSASNNDTLIAAAASGEAAFTESARALVGELLASMQQEGDVAGVTADNLPGEFWTALYRRARRLADLAAKEKGRDPALFREALAAAMVQSGIALDDQAAMDAYTEGFNHALKGKSKSTLTGNLSATKQDGYDRAWAWINTEAGRAWFDGKRARKLQDTGADLRRWFDRAKSSLADKSDSDPAKVLATVQRLTARAKVLDIPLAEDATPGAQAYVEKLRDVIRTFSDWVTYEGALGHLYGSTWRRGDVQLIENFLSGKAYLQRKQDEQSSEYWTPEQRATLLREEAARWLGMLEPIVTALSGAKNVAELAERYKALIYDAEGEMTETGNLLGGGLTVHKFYRVSAFAPDGSYAKAFAEGESEARSNNRTKPLTPPRLDHVERTGLKDYRNGEDVTPQQFKDTFNFADVGFGKWVGAKQDQDHLNYAYDAFMDLATTIGISPKDIGFRGKLYFTIGALGHGKFAAHFAHGQQHPNGGSVEVINLTNTRGDGTVAHEWFHALDFYLGKMRGAGMGADAGVREVYSRLQGTYDIARLRTAVDSFLRGHVHYTSMRNASRLENAQYAIKFDSKYSRATPTKYKLNSDDLGKEYWGSAREMLARAGEAWIHDKLGDAKNNYLVADWVADGATTKGSGYRGSPFPAGDERKGFATVFEAFFKAIDWTAEGPKLDFERMQRALPDAKGDFDNARNELLAQLPDRLQTIKDEQQSKQLSRINAVEASDGEAARLVEEQRRRDEMRRQAEAEAMLAEQSVTADSTPSGPLTEDELESLFDEAENELQESAQEQPQAEAPGDAMAPAMRTATPTPSVVNETAGKLAAEAAKLGVQGIDEALTGLVKLFGGAGKLNSFPGGFDEQTYAQAKPHFEAALKAFVGAGKTLKDLFKFLIQQFGAGVRPYAIQFAKEQGLGAQLTKEDNQHAISDTQQAGNNDTGGDADASAGDAAAAEGRGQAAADAGDEGGRSGGSVRGSDERGAQPDSGDEQPGDASGAPAAVDAGGQLGDGSRAGADVRVHKHDYNAPAGSLTREGSWHETASRNLDAIELIKKLEAEQRLASPVEQVLLSKFTGWGASEIRNNLFPGPTMGTSRRIDPNWARADWRDLAQRAKDLLTAEEVGTALQSTQYAHYTSERVIRAIWGGLDRLGFAGGRILEPGMGTGLFAVAAPHATMVKSHYTGVEMDHLTAAIGAQLLQKQTVLRDDFVKRKLPGEFFDLAIGNPPFSDIRIKDDPAYKKYGFTLHDYFFAKSIDKVRPGGLLVFVTSRGTMDKNGDKARQYLAARADLIGAIRLPQTAFKQNAGTEVVTDVLFLQKRKAGAESSATKWMDLAEVEAADGTKHLINEYFAAHPEMVLGSHSSQGSMYRRNEYTVLPLEGDIEAHFEGAVANLPAGVYAQASSSESLAAAAIERDFNPKAKKEGSVYVSDSGKIMRIESGAGIPLESAMKLSEREQLWLADYVGLRDSFKQAQLDQLEGNDWEASLKALNKRYDAFAKKHGRINEFTPYDRVTTDADGNEVVTEYRRFKNNRLLRADVEGTLVESLEQITEDGEIVKGSFLKERTIKRPTRPEVNTLQDALMVSLDEQGRLNLDHIASLAKISRSEVVASLGDLIFEDPNGGWTMADEYLSGDVIEKLDEAEAAAKIDARYERNVKALLLAQPKPLSHSQINVTLGANWVPDTVITRFAVEVLGISTDVSYDADTNAWDVRGASGAGSRYNRSAAQDWGISDRSPHEILDSVLNASSIKITKTVEVDGKKSTVTDQAATAAANDIAKKMREEFARWVWRDADRAEQLAALYNRKFNNIAPRKFDGSHLTLPGLSMRYKLHDHQKRAIWRVIQTGNTYLAHAVGAGKTLEMVVSGMEQRRLGLINKPMYVVPNHMLEQFAAEFMDAYPTANVMVADDVSFHTDNRRRFIAQAAMNNPDAIVITHSAFGLIETSPETNEVVVQELIGQLEAALADESDRHRRSNIEKRIENIKRKFDAKRSAEKKDGHITFEELGVDFLYVDEAHEFRKLDFVTNRTSKGISPEGSQKALDLFIKLRWLNSQRPHRAAVLASGTPVTNTMAELYTVMRYMMPEELDKVGLDHFDAWANMFGEVKAEFEMNAAGKYESVERFSKFVNVPELMKRVRMFMDVLTSSQLGSLVKRPTIIGGSPEVRVIPASEAVKRYLREELERRIKVSREWKPSPQQKGNPDPLINIITDGRLAAIDMRFVDKHAVNDPGSKLNQMIDAMIDGYKRYAKLTYVDKDTKKPDALPGGTQIVFSAVGFGEMVAKSRGFDAKAWIIKRLTDAGVQRSEIAFMSDYNTAAKKEAMFSDMRAGRIKFLIGSPKNMGTGVNVQKRLKALHYLSPPWYPSDVEQPMGRIERQGNQNEEIEALWYATKGTYDSTGWSMNSRKARFIEQAFTGDDSVRSMEDLSEASLYEQASALASGDERAIQLAGMKADIERMSRLKESHAQNQIELRHNKANIEFNLRYQGQQLDRYKAVEAAVGGMVYGEDLFSVFGGERVSAKADIGAAIIRNAGNAIKSLKPKDSNDDAVGVIGKAQGKFDITLGVHLLKRLDEEGKESSTVRVGMIKLKVEDVEFPLMDNSTDNFGELDAFGLATRLNNALNSAPRKVAEIGRNIDSLNLELRNVQSKIGTPFPEERELAEKIAEAATLQEEMAKGDVEIPSDEALLAMRDAQAMEAAAADSANLGQYHYRRGAGKKVEVVQDARPAQLEGGGDYEFFVYPLTDEDGTTWHVLEKTTGLAVANGLTVDNAIDAANERLAAVGDERLRSAVAAADTITDDEKRAAVAELGMESRGNFNGNDTKLTAAWKILAQNDELFRTPISEDTDLTAVFADVAGGRVHIEASSQRAINAQKVWNVYPMERATGRVIREQEGRIYLRPSGEVQIDVAAWKPNSGGSYVYAAVGNWAYNTGRVFSGDDSGISPLGMLRRLENMISLTLKFGSTDFLKPHPDQLDAFDMQWRDGDTEHNLDQMLRASYSAVKNGVFKTTRAHGMELTEKSTDAVGFGNLDNIEYDPADGKFKSAIDGRPFTDADFAELAQLGGARNAAAGVSTLQRAAITGTILRSQGEAAWGRLLGDIVSLARGHLGQLSGKLYSNGNGAATGATPDAIQSALIKAFGAKTVRQLQDSHLVEIVATAANLPASVRISDSGLAVFAGNKAYLIADRMDPSTAHQVLLHEIGEHYGLPQILGPEGYAHLQRRVTELNQSGDAMASAAWQYVAQKYPELQPGGDIFLREVLAQIGQNAEIRNHSLLKSLVDAFKRFLVKLGFTGMIKVSDIQDMVLHSLRTAAANPDGGPRGGRAPDELQLASRAESVQDSRIGRAVKAGFITVAQWKGLTNDIRSGKVAGADGANQDGAGNLRLGDGDTGRLFQFYHGTSDSIDGFDLDHPNRKDQGWLGEGVYLTDDARLAHLYAEQKSGDAAPNILPLTIRLRNPFIADRAFKQKLRNASKSDVLLVTDGLKRSGHDGVVLRFPDGTHEVLVFDPAAVRSPMATFDPDRADSTDLLESRGNFADMDFNALRDAATERLQDAFSTKRTFNSWWHKTVGTQYHKATTDASFGKVFHLAQRFIDDVARYANTAADQAPTLLPKMDSAIDAVRGLATIRRDEKNARAIAEPIFQGTLNDRVYSDAELRDDFNLSDEQVALYREFRKAVDRSLDDLAISEMARVAKVSGLPMAPEGVTLADAVTFYKEHYEGDMEKAMDAMADLRQRQQEELTLLEDAAEQEVSGAGERVRYAELLTQMRARHASETAEAQALIDNFAELEKGVAQKAEQINKLKANGYAPLMRFGQYTVDVYLEDEATGKPLKDADGEEIRFFFGMFEDEAEANRSAKVLQEEYPNAKVSQGVLSEESYRLFRGVTPETVELFARMAGEGESEAFQKYLKMAVNNRSAMKRLIKRTGVKGFNTDPTRVLASFVLSNARAAAQNDYFGDMLRAAAEIPKDKGDVKDEAVKLIEYIQNPREEASALRGMLFTMYLGGSAAAALVNMSQPFMMTYPYLHQFSADAHKHLKDAMKMASRKLIGKDMDVEDEALAAALHRAMDEGVTSPHEVHMLYGESVRSGFTSNRWIRNITKAWGGFFAVAESFNRNATFIAAYRIAEERGLRGDDAYAFAKQSVHETQGIYSKANRPNWARTAVGATVFTFKQYSISYLEFLKRLPAKERAIALGILVLVSGASGLPGSDDLDDLIDTLAQSLGFNLNSKQAKRDFVAKHFGKDAAGFVMHGVSYGLPLDVSSRLGLGNVLPGTAYFKRSERDKSRDVLEIAGPAGGFFSNISDGIGALQERNLSGAFKAVAPKAIGDVIKGVDMATTGAMHDTRGRMTLDNVTPLEAAIKLIGFNPMRAGMSSRERSMMMQDANLLRDVQDSIYERWARGIAEGDASKVAAAKAERDRWNERNPEAKIDVKVSNLQRRVKAIRMSADERFLKAAPRQMKQEVAQALQQ